MTPAPTDDELWAFAVAGKPLDLAGLARLLRSAASDESLLLRRAKVTLYLSAAWLATQIERTLDQEMAVTTLLRDALTARPDELGPPGPDCLEPDALAAAHQADAHMEACARCARAYLDVPPPPDPRDERFDVDAGWQRLRDAGAGEGES